MRLHARGGGSSSNSTLSFVRVPFRLSSNWNIIFPVGREFEFTSSGAHTCHPQPGFIDPLQLATMEVCHGEMKGYHSHHRII